MSKTIYVLAASGVGALIVLFFKPELGFLVVLFATGGLIAVIPIALLRYLSRRAREQRPAPEAQLIRMMGLPEGSRPVVERLGRQFDASYEGPGKNSLARVRVRVGLDPVRASDGVSPPESEARLKLATRPTIVLRSETAVDRWGKRLRLNREFSTGDVAFDTAVYIDSSAPDAILRQCLADSSLRRAVVELLALRVEAITLDHTGLHTSHVVRPDDVARAEVDRTITRLGEIAAALPLLPPPSPLAPYESMLRVAVAGGAFLAWLGLMAHIYREPPLDPAAMPISIVAGIVTWIACIALALPKLRGRSNSLRTIAFLAVVGLPLLCSTSVLTLRWINHDYDTSPAVRHSAQVTDNWSTTYSRNNRVTHHVEIAAWQPGRTGITLDVTHEFAAKAPMGAGLQVTTRSGRLGWEWIENYEVLAAPGHERSTAGRRSPQ